MKSNMRAVIILFVFAGIVLLAILLGNKKTPSTKPSQWVTHSSGIKYNIVQAGQGETPKPGQRVTVHYTGWFFKGYKPDGNPRKGKQFDSSRTKGQPFTFTLGRGQVIRGWDISVGDMKKGERRVIVIPSELAYGKRGHPAGIPPNSILVFDVELLSF